MYFEDLRATFQVVGFISITPNKHTHEKNIWDFLNKVCYILNITCKKGHKDKKTIKTRNKIHQLW